MLKPTFRNILLYFFSKYLLFFLFLMFKHNDFRLLQIKNLNDFGNSLVYFGLMMLPLILIITALFSVPVYYSFKLRNAVYFILLIIAFLVGEYFVYTYWASPSNKMNGVYNGGIGLLFLGIFFFKPIGLILKQK